MLIGVAALSIAAAAQLPSMSVAEFLEKAEALQKRGVLALVSSDFGRLKAQTASDAQAFAADLRSALQTHRRPPACPPKNGDRAVTIQFTPDELLGYFRSIPPSQRNISSKQAFSEFMSKKYPCP